MPTARSLPRCARSYSCLFLITSLRCKYLACVPRDHCQGAPAPHNEGVHARKQALYRGRDRKPRGATCRNAAAVIHLVAMLRALPMFPACQTLPVQRQPS